MKSSLDRRVWLALGSAIFILALTGALSYRWMVISDESERWVRHTDDVLECIQDLNLTMQSNESVSREFALTGNESDLASYAPGVLRAEQDVETLRTLTADNPAQQIHFPLIKSLTDKRIQYEDRIINLRRKQGIAAAGAWVASGGDRPVEDQFQATVGKMRDEELRLRAQRVQVTEHDLSRSKLIVVFVTLLGLLAAIIASRSMLVGSARGRVSEKALRESEENQRMLLEGVQDYAIFMLDPQGKVASWSANAERIKGYTAEEIIGHNFSRFFLPEAIKMGRPDEVLRIAAAAGRHEEFGMFARKDGSEFLASVTVIAMRDTAGSLRGFSEICRDLSEHKQSEARYRGLLEALPDGMVVVDHAGKIVLLNAQAEKQFGYRRDELLGQTVTNIIPKGFAERLIAYGTRTAGEALAQHIGRGIELNGLRKDGTEFPIEIMLSPLESAEGILVTAAIRDITVRKDAESHLAQMEARYRGLLEAAPDGMVVVNQAGQIVLLNAQTEKQFGYQRDELLGQAVTNIIPKGFAERLIADGTRTAAEALAQQIGTGIELYGRRRDRTEFPIEIMLSPLESVEGVLITAAIRDITLRKHAEEHLAQMESRYRGLLEAAPDGMVVVNPAGEIVLLNAQAEQQFGYHRDELLGQNVKNIIPEGFAERLIADALRPTAEAQAQQIGTGIELHGQRKDGNQFPIEIMLSPLESAEGILITAAIRDISERKQLARQLQQSQKMEAVGQLTGGIAHDFNNLLTVIIGNLGLLDLLVSDNQAALKRVQTAQKAAARGADITRRLLAFSSNDGLKPSFVSLEDSVQNMIEMASRGLGLDIKITTDIDPSVPPIFVDSAGLESALLNLVVNARDAMPTGGSIIVSSLLLHLDESHPVVKTGDLKEGDYVCVKVTDTGLGMSRETIERACEPFFTTKKHDKGTGLGLSMVYGFVKQSGGVVRIYSELGNGTTISFYLPILADQSQAVPVDATGPLYENLGGTVLVVDDELDILEVAVAYLDKMGITTFEAHDGASALKIIAQHREIDLMITDIDMAGGMNGAVLAKKARILCPHLSIIFSSGFPAEALKEKAVSLIEGPLLRKPYQRTEFSAMVQRAMEAGSAQPPGLIIPVPPENVQPLSRLLTEENERNAAARQKILVIDDDDDIGELVSAAAETMGCQCTVTTQAATFLEKLAPDTTLVLLDLMMPGMDGIELLRLLAERNCKADIVLISGVGKRTIESAGQLGEILGLSIVGHLQKPFPIADLKKLLQRLSGFEAPPIVHSSPRALILKDELQLAVDNDEFVVYYQPQIDIATGHIFGVEALVRWQHPKHGLIFPDVFIGLMEQFGLIDELGWIVANQGMRDIGKFADWDGTAVALSLNVSAKSLHDLNFPDTLISIAVKHGVSPADLTIEITESGLIKELSKTLDILTRLRMKQVKLSIDDFGTGFAMLQQIKNIPATELKIDRSFVQEMTSKPRDRIMVQRTIEMAHDLGMHVIAEGVETLEQLDILRSNGCDIAQGYLFSRPIPAKEMVNWLHAYRGRLAPSH
jgi:PAS domain S-box-containing protein